MSAKSTLGARAPHPRHRRHAGRRLPLRPAHGVSSRAAANSLLLLIARLVGAFDGLPSNDRGPCPNRFEPTRHMTGLARGVARQSAQMSGSAHGGLSRRDSSSLLRFALACRVASCAGERRNSGAEAELATQPRPPTETLPPPAPEPAGVKVFNVAPGRFVLAADAPTQVATDGALVRRSDEGSGVPVPFNLRRECAPAAAEKSKCIDILPGQPFVALSWNGAECGPCCYSDTPTPVESGGVSPRAPRLQWR